VPAQHLVDRVERQMQAIQPAELVAEAFDPQLPASSERNDALLLSLPDLPSR
jgi:hypothetical protein